MGEDITKSIINEKKKKHTSTCTQILKSVHDK